MPCFDCCVSADTGYAYTVHGDAKNLSLTKTVPPFDTGNASCRLEFWVWVETPTLNALRTELVSAGSSAVLYEMSLGLAKTWIAVATEFFLTTTTTTTLRVGCNVKYFNICMFKFVDCNELLYFMTNLFLSLFFILFFIFIIFYIFTKASNIVQPLATRRTAKSEIKLWVLQL